MSTLWQDIRFGFRMLAGNPGFTTVVVVILAVGIGATTMMLSVVDAVTLRPCPYKDPDTLVEVCETDASRTQENMTSLAGFRDWREMNRVFEQMVGATQWNCVVRTADRTEKSRAMFVSPGFFSVLGVELVLGRMFLPEEERPGGEPVVILSYGHWQRYFHGDPEVIGKAIILDEQAFTVVGVLREGFWWFNQPYAACGIWVPMSLRPIDESKRTYRVAEVIARLKRGVNLAQAQADMDLIAEHLAQEFPDTLRDVGMLVVPISRSYTGMTGYAGRPGTLLILLSIVSATLLIACLHVAGLLMARSAAREKEIAVRATLGAHRLRLARQLLTESVILAALGGLLGFLLAYWGISVLSALRGRSIPWYGVGDFTVTKRLIPWFVDVHMDARVLLYVTAISLLTCVLFGLLPAIGASKANLNESLSAGRTPSRDPRFRRLRSLLVISDVAMAFVLLLGAGLMIGSYARILNIDFQFSPKNVLAMEVEMDEKSPPYSIPDRRLAFSQEVLERVQHLPGVEFATVASANPVTGSFSSAYFEIERLPSGKETTLIPCTKISPDYFRVLQIPLLMGRHFTEHDILTSSPITIINESMAQRFWPDENPIGRSIVEAAYGQSESVVREIVGVVGNVRHSRYSPEDPEVYVPGGRDGWFSMMVHTESDPKGLVAALRREVLEVDNRVVVSDVTFIEDDISKQYSFDRFSTLFLSAFATVALVLAAIGIYGVVSFSVSQRTHEIGIRMALGAEAGDVIRLVVRQGLRPALVGVSIGLVGSFALTRVISSMLYEVSPTDPVTFVGVSLVLAGVALLASYIPARRATKVDPMVALRYE